MRVATYHVEWFDALFDHNANPLIDQKWSSCYNETRADQWHAVGQVMHELDADCSLLVEAPNYKTGRSTVDMLERFASEFGLRAARTALGFTNYTLSGLSSKDTIEGGYGNDGRCWKRSFGWWRGP